MPSKVRSKARKHASIAAVNAFRSLLVFTIGMHPFRVLWRWVGMGWDGMGQDGTRMGWIVRVVYH